MNMIPHGLLAAAMLVMPCAIADLRGAPDPPMESAPTNKSMAERVYSRIQFVESFPDVRIMLVDSFPDLKVQKVSAFADSPGKWQIVDSFPDFKVQIVNAHPDLRVKYVTAFPGVD